MMSYKEEQKISKELFIKFTENNCDPTCLAEGMKKYNIGLEKAREMVRSYRTLLSKSVLPEDAELAKKYDEGLFYRKHIKSKYVETGKMKSYPNLMKMLDADLKGNLNDFAITCSLYSTRRDIETYEINNPEDADTYNRAKMIFAAVKDIREGFQANNQKVNNEKNMKENITNKFDIIENVLIEYLDSKSVFAYGICTLNGITRALFDSYYKTFKESSNHAGLLCDRYEKVLDSRVNDLTVQIKEICARIDNPGDDRKINSIDIYNMTGLTMKEFFDAFHKVKFRTEIGTLEMKSIDKLRPRYSLNNTPLSDEQIMNYRYGLNGNMMDDEAKVVLVSYLVSIGLPITKNNLNDSFELYINNEIKINENVRSLA